MAYSPPNTFADGTVVTAADLEGNADALRVYLHTGIVAGDFENTQWIETRHVQPPEYLPFQGVQHGVTGHQGGQWAGGTNIRLQFATKYLSGNGHTDSQSIHPFPQTAITIDIRQDAFCLFHYWFELENGKDFSDAGYQVSAAERRVYIIPYTGEYDPANVLNYRARCQEQRNMAVDFATTYPYGLQRPFVLGAGYGAKQGTFALDRQTQAPTTFGLAVHSLSDRCGLVNWGVAVEAFYI